MGGSNNFFLFFLILIIPIGIFLFMKSKKKKNETSGNVLTGKRKKLESEAWVTVKKYLKDNNETGKEILELFVLKRPDENDTSQFTKELKQKRKLELKKKKEQEKIEKQKDPVAYKKKKKEEKRLRKPELWCLYFVTRNPKTKKVDNPRIIEAEVSYKKIGKKETERVIKINPDIDFKKDLEWIKPIKDREDQMKLKAQQAAIKRSESKARWKEKLSFKKKTNNQQEINKENK